MQKKNLKNTNIFMDEDFSPETMEYCKQLWEEVKFETVFQSISRKRFLK